MASRFPLFSIPSIPWRPPTTRLAELPPRLNTDYPYHSKWEQNGSHGPSCFGKQSSDLSIRVQVISYDLVVEHPPC